MKKMNWIWFAALSLALTVNVGCSSDADGLNEPEVPVQPEEPEEPEEPEVPRENPFAFLVASQGNTVSRTSLLTGVTADGTTQDSVFYKVNDRSLGTLLKSVTRVEDRLYAVLNNSLTVEVFDAYTFESIATIALPENMRPMYACYLGNDLLAVSDYNTATDDNNLVIIDTKANEVVRTVNGIGQASQMLVHKNKLFVGGNTFRIFDLDNITLEGMRRMNDQTSLYNSWENSKMVVDKNGNLWIYHVGTLTGGRRLACIDPETETVLKEVMAPGVILNSASKLDISPEGDRIYIWGLLNGVRGIIAVDITATELPSDVLFATGSFIVTGRTMSAITVAKSGNILLCDAASSGTSDGKVHEFTPAGEFVATYTTGMGPQDIYLYE